MELKIDSYLGDIAGCTWSPSDKYFNDDAILHKIGFTGVMDTDTFIQTSFTIDSKNSLSGAQIKTFNNDNNRHENFILYCLSLPNLVSRDVIKITLNTTGLLNIGTVKKIIYSVPLIALVLLNLFTFILPAPVRTVLLYVNLVAILFVILFYLYKGIPIIIDLFKQKKYFINEKKITYLDMQDATTLTVQHMNALAPLADLNVMSAVMYQKKLFLKEPVNETSHPDEEIFKYRLTAILEYLSSEDFQNNF